MTETEQETARDNSMLLKQLLTEPQSSALMQWFIFTAIEEYCEAVLSAREGAFNQDLMIDERTWRACAKEAQDKMAKWKM